MHLLYHAEAALQGYGLSQMFIEKIQVNGGICYFDMMNGCGFRIQKLEMHGGYFHLMVPRCAIKIDNLELNNGHLSITASQFTLCEGLLSGGSFNCKSSLGFAADQVTLCRALSDSSRKQSMADPVSISGLPEIYVKHLDGQIGQHGTTQSRDQNVQMSTVLSPLCGSPK